MELSYFWVQWVNTTQLHSPWGTTDALFRLFGVTWTPEKEELYYTAILLTLYY